MNALRYCSTCSAVTAIETLDRAYVVVPSLMLSAFIGVVHTRCYHGNASASFTHMLPLPSLNCMHWAIEIEETKICHILFALIEGIDVSAPS